LKVNAQGTQIWLENYNYPSGTVGNYIFKMIELPNGDIVAVGGTNNASEGDAGWLLKTDADGNEIWQRKYNKNNNTDLFYSVLLANDGGFLLSGQARNAETKSQDAWLLKVDSVGCPYPNCLVGIDEEEKTTVVADVWPNPASEVLNVQLQKPGKAQITFTDMAGRSYSPPAQEGSGVVGTYLEVDVRAWPNGLYIFTVENGNERARVRVVVQH
jgi:hypothetical protein